MHEELAEREGFEPSVPTRSTQDFQSCAFDHSATSPENRDILCQTPTAHASEKCCGHARGLPGEREITKHTKGEREGHEARRRTITKGTTGTKECAGVARAGLDGRRGGDHEAHGGGHGGTRRGMGGNHDGHKGGEARRGDSLGQRGAGGEGGRERSAGEARRATGGARKPPAQPCVFAVEPRRLGGQASETWRLSRGGSAAEPGWVGRRSGGGGGRGQKKPPAGPGAFGWGAGVSGL